ncbi:hypothetical protein Y032_0560g3469 [Ancylostoma ceylanicum]|uniref:Uncharacterized protein n=1 Tax=Ancylostoma ceylanicum TaxID=53326 RepID=A0A016WRN6_9BILA|nr:hypothetical protein Y032_0560g3469 [Ancylostoma ceylanicum]
MRSSLRFLGDNLRRTIVQANNGQSIGKTVYLTHVKWVTGKREFRAIFIRFTSREFLEFSFFFPYQSRVSA